MDGITNLETAPPRVGNRSDAVELLDALIGLVKNDTDKKGLIIWYALGVLRDALESEVI
jgi:hypothetical protein